MKKLTECVCLCVNMVSILSPLSLLLLISLVLGYYGDGLNAIVVFAVCFMPESSQPNYRYLMDNLFK